MKIKILLKLIITFFIISAFINCASSASAGNLEQEIAEQTRQIQLNPNNAEAFWNRGAAYGEKGDYVLAIADFNEAIRIDPVIRTLMLTAARYIMTAVFTIRL